MKKQICSNCNEEKHLQNKFFKLCIRCNQIRLKNKSNKYIEDDSKSALGDLIQPQRDRGDKMHIHKTKHDKKSTSNEIKKDEIFYKKCFDSCKIHECENCGCKLPDIFRDDNGKIVARYRYSHIIAKSISPSLRRVIKNINHLCLKCHSEWEFGDKKNMRIYKGNKKRFPNRLK